MLGAWTHNAHALSFAQNWIDTEAIQHVPAMLARMPVDLSKEDGRFATAD